MIPKKSYMAVRFFRSHIRRKCGSRKILLISRIWVLNSRGSRDIVSAQGHTEHRHTRLHEKEVKRTYDKHSRDRKTYEGAELYAQ